MNQTDVNAPVGRPPFLVFTRRRCFQKRTRDALKCDQALLNLIIVKKNFRGATRPYLASPGL